MSDDVGNAQHFGKNQGGWGLSGIFHFRNTIIESSSRVPVVSLQSDATEKYTLRGFTLRGGDGAIIGQGTHATIEYNIISNCVTSGVDRRGVISRCNGLIRNNIIENNVSGEGAFSGCDGTIQNNLIRGNRTVGGTNPYSGELRYYPGIGGAFENCNGLIRNNTVVDN